MRCHCVWTKCTCPRQKHTNGSTHHQSSRLQRLKLRIAATVPFSFATTALYCCDSALDRSNSDFDCSTDFPVLLPKKQTLCCCNKALQCGQTTLYCRETFFMAAKGPFTAENFFWAIQIHNICGVKGSCAIKTHHVYRLEMPLSCIYTGTLHHSEE